MEPTFFEGPEKKVELAVVDGFEPLRGLPRRFWESVVATSRAQVLSVLQNARCDAYLLSESSLFVYDSSVTMITCGRTRLVDAVVQMVEHIGADNLELLMYERKNEHWPERQPTSFYDDAKRLAQIVPGQALRFGDEHDHNVRLFHSTRPYVPDHDDTTLEILMHGLPDDAAARWIGRDAPETGTIAAACGVEAILPGFAVDEHAFTPAGYSMNGVRGSDYYTIHVTPESIGSYVSFETNCDYRANLSALVGRVLEVFSPRSFDVVAFAPEGTLEDEVAPPGYVVKDQSATVVLGYDVGFWHCYRPLRAPREPVVLPL